MGLTAIAVLILMLAMTNYLNLATVRSVRRQREIAMRKVLGASAGRVCANFERVRLGLRLGRSAWFVVRLALVADFQ